MNNILKIHKEVKDEKPTLVKNFLLVKAVIFVFILVIGANWLNKRHLSMVQSTMDSVYENRIIAQYFVYKLNHQFHLKRSWLSTNGIFPHAIKESTTIEQLLTDFGAIKLTANESSHLNDLEREYLKLLDLEESILGSTDETLKKTHLKMNVTLDRIMVIMNDLTNINYAESLILSEREKKSLNMDRLLLKVEIASLIIIGIIVQLIIFYPGKAE